MAKLSAQKNGNEIGRIKYLTYTKAYFDSGKVLVNRGHGWKVHGQVKAGNSPHEVFASQAAASQSYLQMRPAFAAYKSALHLQCALGEAWKLHMAIEMMPSDPDGVWSHCCGLQGVNEIAELCRLYEASQREACELIR